MLGEWHQRKRWILAPDGRLLFVAYEEEFRQYGTSRGCWKFDSTVQPMTVQNVLEMDHDHPHRSGSNARTKERWWGNSSPGRLRAYAPGVGVSLALKHLLAIG